MQNLNDIRNPDIIQVGQNLILKDPSQATNNINTYTIKDGDTLSGIAAKYGTTIKQLQHLNNIKSPHKIFAGQKIKITENILVK